MSQEQLDIVDENNNPIGQTASRVEAHERGLWHRTVHIYFWREKGRQTELLVHLRSKDKDSSPDIWDTHFGGHIRSGKSMEEAARDEVCEETGLDILQKELIDGNWWTKSEKRKHFRVPGTLNRIYFVEFFFNQAAIASSSNRSAAIRTAKSSSFLLATPSL